MTGVSRLEPEFVDVIPDDLQPGTLYIAIEYATAQHLCCCGCGTEVVTPLHPAQWRLTYDGETVSLHPSVGNWGLPCGSHYVVRRNQVQWAPRWTPERIEAGRRNDRLALDDYYSAHEGLARSEVRPLQPAPRFAASPASTSASRSVGPVTSGPAAEARRLGSRERLLMAVRASWRLDR